ncbi:MAG TPA: HAD family hydrolase [Solirubrobacteraceae bacterium]|jgi:D-glycero-D-manno-heptose 1,7-bisphosphate phosphatase|nr:HAD family hydrolase [Solirubrobacteraceae bacterium]
MAAGITPVAFLDRDGTINVKAPQGEYITRPDDLVLLPRSAQAIRRLNDAGVRVAVVTNQRGLALGRMTEHDLTAIHARLRDLLREAADAELDLVLHCPHDLGGCRCRKPLPGMLADAATALGPIDMAASVMIGDSPTDALAGQAFGIRSLLLGSDTSDLYAAVSLMLEQPARPET